MNRAERRHRTERIVERRFRQARQMDIVFQSNRDPWPMDTQKGHGKTKSHLSCGRARCGVCHPEKQDKGTRKAHYERQAIRQGADE